MPFGTAMVDYPATPTLISLNVGGDVVQTHCVELAVLTNIGATGYRATDWAGYAPQSDLTKQALWSANRKRVLWILAHSTPTMDAGAVLKLAGITGVTAGMEAAVVRDATASAIWNLANGATLVAVSTSAGVRGEALNAGNSAVFRLYTWYLDNAGELEAPSASLAFSAPTTTGQAGNILGTVTLSSSNPATITTTLPTGVTLKVAHAGNAKPAATYTGAVSDMAIASGATLSLVVAPNAAAGEIEVAAQSTGQTAAQGMVWFSKGSQSLITAKSGISTLRLSLIHI